MIEANNLSKSFQDYKALEQVNIQIRENTIFGLIGSNGAGKSTFLRLLTGVLKPDEGEVLVDGEKVYNNPGAKSKIFFIPDEHYFFSNGSPIDMARFYRTYYPDFQMEKWKEMMQGFGLEENGRIAQMSKGMKKQVSLLLGICSNTKYLVLDETFDGLDPVMRQGIKSILIKEMDERGLTPIIASHNLREMEDICECVGLLHKGKILLQNDMEGLKAGIHRLQLVAKNQLQLEEIKEHLHPVLCESRGSLYMLTVRGQLEEIQEYMSGQNLVFYETLPLSMEEIFISEMEVKGYDIKKLLI